MAYVYLHTRLDTDDIFYIGIGNSDTDNFRRAYNKTSRNVFWKNITNKTQYRVDIVYRNISLEESYKIETKLINLYGRRDLKKGNLVNLTDGGECNSNISDETRLKMSEAAKGNKNNLGKKYSLESRLKMSESRKGKVGHNKGKIGHNKGKLMTEEQKIKISNSTKGRIVSEETRLKISNTLKLKNKNKNI
jgi:hypothetical protein